MMKPFKIGIGVFLHFVVFSQPISAFILKQDEPLKENSTEPWGMEIEPGIRRIGVVKPSAKYRCPAEPVVSPAGEYFLLHNTHSIHQFDCNSEALLNQCEFESFDSLLWFAISHDGDYIAVMGTVYSHENSDDQNSDEESVSGDPERDDFETLSTDDPLAKFRNRIATPQINRIRIFDRDLKQRAVVDVPSKTFSKDDQVIQDAFRSIAFSFDHSKLIVSGSTEAMIIDWPAEQIEQRITLESKESHQAFAISPIEICLKSRDSSQLRIWNLKSDKVSNWDNLKLPQNSLLLDRSPDGSLLYFNVHPKRHFVCEPTQEKLIELEDSAGLEAVRICFSPDNRFFAGVFRDTHDKRNPQRMGMMFWDAKTGKSVRRQWLEGFNDWFTCRLIGKEANRMLVSHRDGIHTVVELDQPLEPQLIAAFQHMPLAIGLEFGNRDQNLAMLFSGILDIETGAFQSRYRFPGIMSPTSTSFLESSTPTKGVITAQLRDYKTGEVKSVFQHRVLDQDTINLILKTLGRDVADLSMGGQLVNARFSPDGRYLYALFQEYKLGLRFVTWDFKRRRLTLNSLAKVFPRTSELSEVQLSSISSDGTVYAVNDHGTVRVIESETANPVHEIRLSRLANLELSRDGKQLAVGEIKKLFETPQRVKAYELPSGKVLFHTNNGPLNFGFATGSDRFFVAPEDSEQELIVLETEMWRKVLQYRITKENEKNLRTSAAISADGKTLAIALDDTRIEIWEVDRIGSR